MAFSRVNCKSIWTFALDWINNLAIFSSIPITGTDSWNQACWQSWFNYIGTVFRLRRGFCGIFFSKFSQIFSDFLRFSLLWKTDATKSWVIFQKFNSWIIKLTKTPILPNCQVANVSFCINVTFIIQGLKFCKIAHHFLWVSFSHERKHERLERIFFSQNPNLIKFWVVIIDILQVDGNGSITGPFLRFWKTSFGSNSEISN